MRDSPPGANGSPPICAVGTQEAHLRQNIMGVTGSKGQRENVKIWHVFVMALIHLRVL